MNQEVKEQLVEFTQSEAWPALQVALEHLIRQKGNLVLKYRVDPLKPNSAEGLVAQKFEFDGAQQLYLDLKRLLGELKIEPKEDAKR